MTDEVMTEVTSAIKTKIMENKTLKIVQIIPELNLKIMGGIGSFLLNLLACIDKQKTENIILTYKSDLEDRAYYEKHGITVISQLQNTQLPDKSSIETTKWLVKTLKKIQPDVVNTHGFWGTVLGVKAAYRANIPVIVSTDDNIDLDENPQQKRIKKNLLPFSDRIICVSNAVRDYAHEIEQVPQHKLIVIYNGIRLEEYPFQLNSYQSSKTPQFIFVARLEPQKRPERVIKAIATLQKKGIDCHLSIIGDGSVKTECQELVKQLQLTDKIKFWGYQEKPWQLISSDSIFVMTSDFEGQPNTILEAFASGYLCILPTIKPALEIAIDGKEALFYEAGNQTQLVEAMELALSLSDSAKSSMIYEAKTKVEKQFDAQTMAQNYLNLYQEMFWQKLGQKLVTQGKLNKSVSAYKKALKINPNSGWCYQNLAEVLGKKGWRKESISFYVQAWLSNPQEVKAWHNQYQLKYQNKCSSRINKKSVFVLGCGHSGTTLMLRILGSHPAFYSINYESRIFQKSELEIQEKLAEWDEICQENNKLYWVEKTPDHIYALGKIITHCPNSKIVWIVRDGRDVICSQLNARLKKLTLEKLLNNWIASNIAGMNFLKDSRIKLVKYENLVTKTVKTLKDICDFLEEKYTSEMLNYHQNNFYFMNNKKLTKPEDINHKRYVSQLRNWQTNQPIFDGRGRWQKEMTNSQKTVFKQKAQEYLLEFGYVNNSNW